VRFAAHAASGLILAMLALPVRPEPPRQVVEPLDIGFSESTGRALLFLDVEATDAKGRPMPGLTRDDFKVKLDLIPRRLYSVDDLCPCNPQTGEVDPTLWDDPSRLEVVLQATRPWYVLYFDFSQLQTDGREQSLASARRWVRETMLGDDHAQIVAYALETGPRRLTAFTSDKSALLRALDDVDRDPAFHDEFPAAIWDRRERCSAGLNGRALVEAHAEARSRGSVSASFPGTARDIAGAPGGDVACYYFARKESSRTADSLQSLLYFISALDEVPGRTALLFFHQNNATFPGRLYSFSREGLGAVMLDGAASALVPDLARHVERVSGAATQARTSIYPLVTGYGETWAVNMGANVADATGGRHNLGAADVDSIADSAGRGCGCYYRIGFRAPERGSHVYHTKVVADGHPLPRRYRLEFLADDDRWMRRAEAVLASAGDADGVEMTAALIPKPSRDRNWDLEVQIAVDVTSLELIPGQTTLSGEWEAGALLVADDGRKSWELLNASRVIRPKGSTAPASVLHTRTFKNLPPGKYELRGFVHDRTSDRWGSARATVRLPDPETPGVVGPILVQPDVEHLSTDLPTRKKKRKAKQGAGITTTTRGPIPTPHTLSASDAVELRSWVCPGTVEGLGGRIERVLSSGDEPLEHLAAARLLPAGRCVEIRDAVDPAKLSPGPYLYRLRVAESAAVTTMQAELELNFDEAR